jgi:hypothetical protein
MDITSANQYFADRLETAAWDSAADSTKTKAIAQATRELKPYEDKADSTNLGYAICEQALWLIQNTARARLQIEGVAEFSLGQGGRASEKFNLAGRDPNIAPRAWAYLRGPTLKLGGLR